MNRKFKLALIGYTSEKGFALPVVVGMGLIMTLIGMTMIMRSQGDRVTASAQKGTARSLSAAEVGVTRYQALINNNRVIAKYPDCVGTRDSNGVCPDDPSATPPPESWASATSIPGTSTCGSGSGATAVSSAATTTNWEDIGSRDSNKGQYRLVSYNYSPTVGKAPGTGTLTVEGRVNQSSSNPAISRLQVDVPILEKNLNNINVPGGWIKSGGIPKNSVEGDVFINDCDVDLSSISVTGADPDTDQPYQARHTSMDFPDLPPKPVAGTDLPSNHALGSLGKNNYVFPRPGDTPTTKVINGNTVEVYEYLVDSIDLNNNTLKIESNKRVTFYLNGNIEKKSKIIHSCTDNSDDPIPGCKPTNFQIFGYGGAGSKICTSGNKKIEAFIFAPGYTGGVGGSGGGKGGIKGSIWLDNWSTSGGCGSSTSNTVIEQTARWEEIDLTPKNLPPRIDSITTWERQQKN